MRRVRLTESDLIRVIERIVKEQSLTGGKSKPEFKGRLAKSKKDFGMGWRDEFDRPSE